MLKENSSQLIDGEQIWEHEKLQQNENWTQSDPIEPYIEKMKAN